jgi:hypothetical protein
VTKRGREDEDEERKDHAYWSAKAATLEALVDIVRVEYAAGGTMTGEVATAYFTAVQLGWRGHMGLWCDHVRAEDAAPARRRAPKKAAAAAVKTPPVETEASVDDAAIARWLDDT